MITPAEARLCVLGLGYVGLPLAVAFGVAHDTVGYDLDSGRIAELRRGEDRTLEVDPDELKALSKLRFSDDDCDLADRNVFIVTVPTPIDGARRPDLGAVARRREGGNRGGYSCWPGTSVRPRKTSLMAVPSKPKAARMMFST